MPRGTVGEEEEEEEGDDDEGGLLLEINCINSLDRTGTDQQETQAFDVSDCFLGLDAQKITNAGSGTSAQKRPERVRWVLLHDLSFPARGLRR